MKARSQVSGVRCQELRAGSRGRMGKRGMIMGLYIVMLTLVMCGFVIMSSLAHKGDLSISLVSPKAVLETRGELDIFEMREKELIRKSLKGVSWGVVDFEKEFLNSFVGELDTEMKEFIISDLVFEGKGVGQKLGDEDDFFEKALYSVEKDSGDLILKRREVGKMIFLEADKESDVVFPVWFRYDFSAEYLIEKKGSGYLIGKR